MHNSTELKASVFQEAMCKVSGVTHEEEVKPPPEKVKSTSPRVGQEDEKVEAPTPSPSPRVGNTQASPRVEAGGSPFDSSIPNLIPADDDKSDSESDSDDDGIECNDEPPPLYITRPRTAKKAFFASNVTRDALLTLQLSKCLLNDFAEASPYQ